MNQQLKHGLELFEMISTDGQSVKGLVAIQYKAKKLDYDYYTSSNFSIEEIIAIEKAAEFNVDYIYLRYFPERPEVALPQIYIFDYTEKSFDENIIKESHRRLWNAVQVPMFFVFLKNEVKIFNCFDAPYKKKQLELKPFQTIALAANSLSLIQEFSAKKIDNGSFWETSKFAQQIKFSGSAYERLLRELKYTLKDILKEKILEEPLAKKLMIKSILVKYLEERKDENGNTVFPKAGDTRQYVNGVRKKKEFETSFFERFVKGATSFVDILNQKGAIVGFFKYLSKHFNGEIFSFSDEEYEILANKDLSRFAYFFDKKTEGKNRQLVFWDLYSFEDLPVELISNVYEEFLEKKQGIVYTPPYLVNFLLDESIPFSNTQTDFKVLDPACGSGIFLVGAYKRLIYRWRAKNNWRKPDIHTLQQLLKENIFGVDKEPEAINLAAFSLSLALCDELSPLVIWDYLKFDNLKNENLFDSDFFELIKNEQLEPNFNLVIGNPPFDAHFTKTAQEIEDKRKVERIIEWKGENEKVNIPGKQIALLFLDQAIKLCNEEGLLCLILPTSDFLYNYTADKYRTWFFQNHHTFQVIDFTNLSGCLFGIANVSVAALFARNHLPEDIEEINHITVRRNYIAEEKLFFELDHYDFHKVSYDESLSKNFVWKANLFGGGRLQRLLTKLSSFKETLGNYLKRKEKENGWKYGEGFIIGNRKKIELREKYELGEEINLNEQEIIKLLKDYKRADWITNKLFLDEDDLTSTGINWSNVKPINHSFFYRRSERKKKIFNKNHIIIKEIISNKKLPIAFVQEYLTFSHRMVGIHAPKEDTKLLRRVYDIIKDNLTYVFYIALTSSEFSISLNNTTAILKKDIDNLPYPSDNLEKLNLSKTETIIRDDTINYWLEYATGKKKDLALFQDVTGKELKKFEETYCNLINSIYDDFHPLNPISTDTFICFPFYIGNQPLIEIPDKDQLEQHLNQLLINENPAANLRIIRILRLYESNVVYLIKPKKLRYWLQSVAIQDADETFADLVAQEYQL